MPWGATGVVPRIGTSCWAGSATAKATSAAAESNQTESLHKLVSQFNRHRIIDRFVRPALRESADHFAFSMTTIRQGV